VCGRVFVPHQSNPTFPRMSTDEAGLTHFILHRGRATVKFNDKVDLKDDI
jgi:inosine/xanthosine triphosphate pyrophosphatase family protein